MIDGQNIHLDAGAHRANIPSGFRFSVSQLVNIHRMVLTLLMLYTITVLTNGCVHIDGSMRWGGGARCRLVLENVSGRAPPPLPLLQSPPPFPPSYSSENGSRTSLISYRQSRSSHSSIIITSCPYLSGLHQGNKHPSFGVFGFQPHPNTS